MKVLYIFSGNTPLGVAPFINEQAMSLRENGVSVDYFPIKGKGIISYIRSVILLKKIQQSRRYDIVHGFYIWSMLPCLFARGAKKIGTFLGSDLNVPWMCYIARNIIDPFLDAVIVVSDKMKVLLRSDSVKVIPFGVDIDFFHPTDDSDKSVHPLIRQGMYNILFCSRFDRIIKNYPLARQAIDLLSDSMQINLIEFKGLTRQDIQELLNQVDMMLLTSFSEGSPQSIKEAMACNCPVVCTNVGDVHWLFQGVDNCEVSSFEASDVAEKTRNVLLNGKRSNGRNRIMSLSLSLQKAGGLVLQVYESVLAGNRE